MGTKKKARNERSREDSRTKLNGAGKNSAKTRPDFQDPSVRQAENKKRSRTNSHAGTGAGAPGVPDAPEGGKSVSVRTKHTPQSKNAKG